MIKGIEHVAIYSKDTKRLSEWYIKMFDGEIVYDNGKGTYFVAFSDKSMIEFCLNENTENDITELDRPGIRHIAFYVDNLNEATDRVVNENVEILKPMSVSAKGVGTMFFRDIDGNIVHFISRPSPLI